MKRCPYCAESILAAALKCKHCGEMLAPGLRPGVDAAGRQDSRSGGVAAILEVLPGLLFQTFGIGHMYAGNVGYGLFCMFGYWFVLMVNVVLVFFCGIGIVTGALCWVLMMITSAIAAANSVRNR